MARVAVFGLGYVGCVTGACLARDGHAVVGVDVAADKVAAVAQGLSPLEEPGLAELIAEQAQAGRLTATADVAGAVAESDLALVAVGTPSNHQGAVSTQYVARVVQAIGEALAGGSRRYVVVVRSTLLPGILEGQLAPLLSSAAGRPLGADLALANNPEFLREATAIADYDRPPLVLVGAEQSWAAEQVLGLYQHIDAEKVVTDTRTAALVKYACNAYHAAKVTFANEIGALAQQLGADGQQVMRILCQDRKLNVSPAYLRPGFAFGGSCLPKDVRALVRFAQEEAIRIPLLDALLPSNEEHLRRGVRLVQEAGVRKLGLVGLSFKAGTDDLRESPLVILAETLLGKGFDLRIYDPGVMVGGLRGTNRSYVDQHLPHLADLLVADPAALLTHAELLVLGTDIADKLDRAQFAGPVIDLRRDLVVPVPLDAARSLAGH